MVRNDLVLRLGGHVAFAFRQDSLQLAESLNNFLKTHREGTMLGNVLINRNFRDFDWVKNSLSTKDLDFIRKRYFDDPAVDRFNRTLMAFAFYNAGPAGVQGLRKKAASQGLDPNVWFDNVAIIAAREIGNETVQYVSNVYKY